MGANGCVLARWPYPLRSHYGLTVSTLPTLIRTLGPIMSKLPGKPATVLRRRLEITGALIDQLPRLACFEQVFDPSIQDALAFVHRPYVVGAAYCFRIPAGQPEAVTWNGMVDKTRNVIRKAAATLQVDAIEPVEFCRFYDANLGGVANMHGADRMRSLLTAVVDRGAGIIVGARNPQGLLEAAVTFVWDASVIYYLLATRKAEANANCALSLLVWHGIRLACQRDLTFDFDGAVTPGLALFLSGFGGLLTQRLRVRRMSNLYRIDECRREPRQRTPLAFYEEPEPLTLPSGVPVGAHAGAQRGPSGARSTPRHCEDQSGPRNDNGRSSPRVTDCDGWYYTNRPRRCPMSAGRSALCHGRASGGHPRLLLLATPQDVGGRTSAAMTRRVTINGAWY